MHFSAANFAQKCFGRYSQGVCQSSVPDGVGLREHNLDNSGPLSVKCDLKDSAHPFRPPYAFLGEGRFFRCRHGLTPQISRNQNLKIQGWIRLMDARRDCRCQLSLATPHIPITNHSVMPLTEHKWSRTSPKLLHSCELFGEKKMPFSHDG